MGLENTQVEMAEIVQSVAALGYEVKNIRESNGRIKFTVEVADGGNE